jgi:hypothetical protein
MVAAMVMVLKPGPMIFGILWSAPERSPGPASTSEIQENPPAPDDQAALDQTGKRTPRGSVLGTVDAVVRHTVYRIARLDLVGVSGGLEGADAAVLLNGGEQRSLQSSDPLAHVPAPR